ncbi:MAG TPA: PKD domain-containing protein [Baekduia sp.]|nr:PKD domain-containing protein [Baekduia sp.]
MGWRLAVAGGLAACVAWPSAALGAPVAAFTYKPAEPRAGEQVAFTSSSTPEADPIKEQSWDLDGDGVFGDAVGAQATRTFAAAGNYQVALRVTDTGGKTDTATRTVVVAAAPAPNPPPPGEQPPSPPSDPAPPAGDPPAATWTAPPAADGPLRPLIDPDAFPAGSVLGSQVPALRFDTPVTVVTATATLPSTGTRVLRAAPSCPGQEAGCRSAPQLAVSFGEPVAEAVMLVGLAEAAPAPGAVAQLLGFDAKGALVATATTPLMAQAGWAAPVDDRLAVQVPAGIDLAYVELRVGIPAGDRSPAGVVPITTTGFIAAVDDLSVNWRHALPPQVSIEAPADGIFLTTTSSPPAVSGSWFAPGGRPELCVALNGPPSIPDPCRPPGGGIDYGNGTGRFDIRSLPLQPGRNEVTVWLRDRHRRVASDTVVIEVASESTGIDLRAQTMEITQGVQGDLQFGGSPRAASTVRYAGVSLVQDRMTVVRLFGVAESLGNRLRQHESVPTVKALLHGRRPDGTPLPGSPLWAQFSPSGLRGATLGGLANARRSARGAFTFVLPPTWARGEIALTGVVNPPDLRPFVVECAGCTPNNSFTTNAVRFTPMRPLAIRAWRLQWTAPPGGYPVPGPDEPLRFAAGQVVSPPPIGEVLAESRNVLPWAPGGFQVPADYVGTIPVQALCTPRNPQRRACQGDTRDDINGAYRDLVVAAARRQPGPGINIGISLGLNLGIALDDDRTGIADADRPLTAVAHELVHLFGILHASGACGGGAFLGIHGEDWPPDQVGYLQGFGLDPRRERQPEPGAFMPVPGTLARGQAAYDLMSYCETDENNRWLSPRNWNRIVDGFRPGGSRPADIIGRAGARAAAPARAGAAAAAGPTLYVTGLAHSDGKVELLRVEPGIGRLTPPDPRSPFRVVVRDAAGAVVSSTPVPAPALSDPAPAGVRHLAAEVPAAAGARVELLTAGEPVATRSRSATAPTVAVLAPRPGARVRAGRDLAVRWRAHDRDGDPLRTAIDVSGDRGRTWRTVTVDVRGTGARIPAGSLPVGRGVRVRLRVADGFRETTAIAPPVRVDPRPPRARILSGGARSVPAASLAVLQGEAHDAAGRVLRGARLQWFVGRRRVGSGTTVALSGLAPGRHRVRLVARDAAGRPGSAVTSVRVRPVAPALLGLRIPARLARSARRLTLRTGATVAAHARFPGLHRAVRLTRTARRVILPVRPGAGPLRLRVRLRAGSRSRIVTVEIPRR